MDATGWVGQWLSEIKPQELNVMAKDNERLVERLKPYRFMVKMAKGATGGINLSADDLLGYISAHYPQHEMVITTHLDWYNSNVEELRRYIDAL